MGKVTLLSRTACVMVFVLFMSALPVSGWPVFAQSFDDSSGDSADDTVLQCVADCVIQEGRDGIETCKMRCAGPIIDLSRQPGDCMAVFKQCRKDCDADRDCVQDCKTGLLNCV